MSNVTRGFAILAFLAIGGVLAGTTRFQGRSNAVQPTETARIRSHFDSVVAELRAADVTTLDGGRRVRRARLIATLESYRDRGLFPHNYDVPGQRAPSFVDTRTGVRCAVGHLLETTGRGDIVERVARTNLHVLAMDLSSDTAFTGWLDESGLTLAEAARIQPQYDFDDPRSPSHNLDVPVALAAGGSAGLMLWNVIRNMDGHNRKVALVGMVGGLATMALAIEAGVNERSRESLASAALLTGTLSTVTGTWSLLRGSNRQTPNQRMVVSPTLNFSRPASPASVGLSARWRF
jgi:hypothetical protein